MGNSSHRDPDLEHVGAGTKAQNKNSNIKELPHVGVRPVTVEREHPDRLVIEGVSYSGDLFRSLAFPPGNCLYSFKRDGDAVILTTVHNLEEAQEYFEEVEG